MDTACPKPRRETSQRGRGDGVAFALRSVLLPLLSDTSQRIDAAILKNKRVLFEGAQGTLLDIDMGTYPFVELVLGGGGGSLHGIWNWTDANKEGRGRDQGLCDAGGRGALSDGIAR